MRRASLPLDPAAVAAANAAVAPETGGRALTMGPEDAALRTQWMDAYLAALGAPPDDDAGADADPDEVVRPCSRCAALVVTVAYTPLPAPIAGATVTIVGPETLQAKTDAGGVARFDGITPGDYEVSADYRTFDRAVEAALGMVGSSDYSYYVAKDPYPAETNKCNLFVFDMANAGGKTVPRVSRYAGLKWRPPLAGEWAGPDPIGDWKVTPTPEPGDTVAEAHRYADATGHVGLAGYPEQVESIFATAPEGGEGAAHVDLHRRTISQSSATDKVENNDWGFRSGQGSGIVFKRYSP